MKTLITIAILIILFFLIAKTKIIFSPFHIEMKSWRLAVGVYIVFLGFGFISHHYHAAGFKEGSETTFKAVDSAIKLYKKAKQ